MKTTTIYQKTAAILAMLVIMLFAFNACSTDDDSDDISASIGDLRDGGIVFYVVDSPVDLNGDGKLDIGLVAATSDQGTGANFEWLEGVESCANFDEGGYSDWFLPSKDQLNMMYVNLKLQDLGEFHTYFYWSSTEVNDESSWAQNFEDGEQRTGNKRNNSHIRAVRAF